MNDNEISKVLNTLLAIIADGYNNDLSVADVSKRAGVEIETLESLLNEEENEKTYTDDEEDTK